MPPISTFVFVGPGVCFPSDTLISTPNGKTEISTLCIGDKVLSLKEGVVVIAEVVKVHKSRSNRIISCETQDGAKVRATPSHPFLTSDFNQKELCQFRLNEMLIFEQDDTLIHSPISSLALKYEEEDVYNLTVEPGNTYFANGIAVHNKP